MSKAHKPVSSLDEAKAMIRKQYGDGAVMTDEDAPENIDVIPTGCMAIDYVLGCGGLPRGRIIEVYGGESSGKSSTCLFLAGEVQRSGGVVAYLDVENAYDRSYANLLGVDTANLLLSQPATLEETFDIIRAYVETNSVDLIIVDSVAAMTPKAELEEEDMLKDTVALQARLLGRGLRILTGPIGRSKTVVMFINQTRTNVGVMYGPKDTTPGGKALKFFASVRLNVKRVAKIENTAKEHIGNTLSVTGVKNKTGAPSRSAEFDLYFGEGVDVYTDILTYGVKMGIVTLTGNTYSYGDKKLGVGKEKAKALLKEDEEVFNKIKKDVYDAQGAK